MADLIYNTFMYNMARRKFDWSNVTMKVALVDDTYTPSKDDDTWESGSDPYDSEISAGNGYTAGGTTVTSNTVQQNGTDLVELKISVPSWTASGGSIGPARYGVLYIVNPLSPQTNILVYNFDFSSNQTASDTATFRININSQTSGEQILLEMQQQ